MFGFDVDSDGNDEESDEEQIDPDVHALTMERVLTNATPQQVISLPPHLRCSAHTLNLIASKDLIKAPRPGECNLLLRASMAKCSSLWNRVQRSTQAHDIIENHIGRALIIPNDTRWNSLFLALSCITEIQSKTLENAMDELNLPRFSAQERKFIADYCKILGPLSQALNILQGENDAYLGNQQINSLNLLNLFYV